MDKKFYYKLELIYVKYSPMIISLGLLLHNILAFLKIPITGMVGYLWGVSLLTVGHMYNSSRVYKFCKYHRMFIHYIVISNLSYIIDYYIGIPLSFRGLFALNMAIAGIFLFLILYYYLKYGDREV